MGVIGKHEKTAETIREIQEFFISYGSNDIIIYDHITFNKINQFKSKSKNIIEIKNNNLETELITTKNSKIHFPFNYYEIEDHLMKSIDFRFLIKLKDNSFISSSKNGLFITQNFFSNFSLQQKFKIINQSFFGGIKINEEICAFISNKIISNEDKISFYNLNSKQIFKEIDKYSFNISQNSLSIMPYDENKKNKIILCACKKYNKNQKNGILLLKFLNKSFKIYEKFYNTKNFEVYCFCPILIINQDKNIFDKKEKIIIDTEYFFVGGFDNYKKKGIIKIYQVKYNENFEKTEINYLNDIEIKNYNFEMAISCITQSFENGKILITCLDGSVCLFTTPNLELLKKLQFTKLN